MTAKTTQDQPITYVTATPTHRVEDNFNDNKVDDLVQAVEHLKEQQVQQGNMYSC